VQQECDVQQSPFSECLFFQLRNVRFCSFQSAVRNLKQLGVGFGNFWVDAYWRMERWDADGRRGFEP
jgi:hypothetical protein